MNFVLLASKNKLKKEKEKERWKRKQGEKISCFSANADQEERTKLRTKLFIHIQIC